MKFPNTWKGWMSPEFYDMDEVDKWREALRKEVEKICKELAVDTRHSPEARFLARVILDDLYREWLTVG